MQSSRKMSLLEAEIFDGSASCQLSRYFIGLPRASEKLPVLHLGLYLTVSVSPWCASALARPDSGSPIVATVTLTAFSLLIFMLTVSGLLSHFTALRNARIASAVGLLATAIQSVCRPSVCLSVCHTPVLCRSKRLQVARCSLHCQIAKYV